MRINSKLRLSAVKDYLESGESLTVVSARHGIAKETLRKYLGNKVRAKGNPAFNAKRGTSSIANNGADVSKVRVERKSSLPTNANRRWTPEDDAMLRDAVMSKFTVKETMELLGRTNASLYSRKCLLMEQGFIKDTRFVHAPGIKRTRKNVMDAPVIEATIVSVEEAQDNNVVETNDNLSSISDVKLLDLAKIVKDYGIKVTVSVSASGTEIKMD